MAGSRLHSVFTNLISLFRSTNKQNSTAQQGQGQRTWQIPTDLTTDIRNVPQLHKPSFDRTEINTNYTEIHKPDNLTAGVGDAGSLKVQLDYVAIAERAFRSRHASHIRCLTHTAARYAGHSNEAGVFMAVQNYAQDLSKAGSD